MKKERLEQLSLELGMKFDESSELFTEETLNSMKLFSLVGEGMTYTGTCSFVNCSFIECAFGKCGDTTTKPPSPWVYCIDFACVYPMCDNTTQPPV